MSTVLSRVGGVKACVWLTNAWYGRRGRAAILAMYSRSGVVPLSAFVPVVMASPTPHMRGVSAHLCYAKGIVHGGY